MNERASVLASVEASDQLRLTVEGTTLRCRTRSARIDDARIIVVAEAAKSRRLYRIETQWTSGDWLDPLVDVGDPDSRSAGFSPWGTLEDVEAV